MRKYLLILNAKAIADFMTYGRALNAFRRRMLHLSDDEVLQLIRLEDGYIVASSI